MAAPYAYGQSPAGLHSATPTALRRQHAVQPPSLLTTSLENARHPSLATPGGVLPTPVSTTTLSTPFAAYPIPSPYIQSPGGAMRGTSPMTFRSHGGFAAPYNPQQWGPLSDGAPQSASSVSRTQRSVRLAPRPVGPDEPVASPPPPYSPRRSQELQPSPRNVDYTSPSDTTSPDTEFSPNGTPISAATTLSPGLLHSASSRSKEGAQNPSASASPNLASTPSFPPPPPGVPKSKGRPAPKISTGGLLSSLRTKTLNSAVPVDATHNFQNNNGDRLEYNTESPYPNGYMHPPAARRAASTGAIGLSAASSRSNSHSPSPVTWELSVPLPPPPPGPPPASARSQSLNRFTDSPSSATIPTLPFRHRAPPGKGTALDTVPPTPADWRDESPEPSKALRNRSRSNGPSLLHIDTGSILHKRGPVPGEAMTASEAVASHVRRDSSTSGLFRSPAVRNRSAKGIRERRSESRNGKGREVDDSAVDTQGHEVAPWDEYQADDSMVKPTDLVLPATQPYVASNLQKNPRISPGSARSMQSLEGAMKSPHLRVSSGKAVPLQSSNATPQADSARLPLTGSSRTPLLSPKVDTFGSPAAIHSISSPRSAKPSQGISLIIPPSPGQRPVSHLLHIPNSEDSMQVPLTPSTKASQRPVSDLIGPESPTAFAARANERHQNFAAREAAAGSNSERLDLFVQFMMAESRIRRDQYAAVFEADDIDTGALVQGFFGQAAQLGKFEQQRELSRDPPSTQEASGRTSIASSAIDSFEHEESSSASHVYESPGSVTSNSSIPNRLESGWAKDYVPCLSPIASMSIVTGQDEMDSRGRAPSRWWEGSRSGDAPNDGFDVLARSKRESKYMGVSKDAPMSPLVYESRMSGSASNSQWQGGEPSNQYAYGPDEYPPEKTGWAEENTPHQALPPTPASASYASNSKQLDISRLVTLPPPYPRHHPAVNNSHPELDSIRSVVRSLHEKSEVDAIRETYRSRIHTKRQRAQSWQEHQRSLHQQNVQFSISHGEMSSEQYEAAEAELEEKILQSEKDTTQAAFDIFQSSVLSPLHAIFTKRIGTATDSLHSMSTSLFSDAQSPSPNLPQEEGDEKPELLERLTMLKWLFEAREHSHRSIYDLLSERNDLYKAIVLLPYANNPSKKQDALHFFADDARDRSRKHAREVADRSRAFLAVIETNVSRGVEVQLDAFWQIAPPLKGLLEKIPSDLEAATAAAGGNNNKTNNDAGYFEVRIPPDEYAENPAYHAHPLQYLYSLLSHAEKSTYQFIESQVNLLCLLHEIRNAALVAMVKAEAEAEVGDEGGSGGGSERRGNREEEERRLTRDLKEKVGIVEGQWEEALGAEIREVQERIRGQLLLEGGWEDEG